MPGSIEGLIQPNNVDFLVRQILSLPGVMPPREPSPIPEDLRQANRDSLEESLAELKQAVNEWPGAVVLGMPRCLLNTRPDLKHLHDHYAAGDNKDHARIRLPSGALTGVIGLPYHDVPSPTLHLRIRTPEPGRTGARAPLGKWYPIALKEVSIRPVNDRPAAPEA